MTEALDPFWQAAAEHVAALGLAPSTVFAPVGFDALLPGCRTRADIPVGMVLSALILHKGRLGDVPADILLHALDHLTVNFANEVFLVFTGAGDPVAEDSPHVPGREALLTAALHAAAMPQPGRQATRMPPAYMGQGRVLLETEARHLMLVDGGDTSIAPHLLRDGWFDRHLTDALMNLIVPGMVCMDIGANFGTYALIAASQMGPRGRLIAVEPVPRIAALLTENLVMNGFDDRAIIVRCAVGAKAGMVTMHEFATRQGGNTLHAHVAATAISTYGEQIVTREVPCRTLDDLADEYAPDRLDFVKIDVEGFEQQVLQGGAAALGRLRPRLLLEWHNAFFAAGSDDARALHELLTGDLGYTLHRIEAGGTSRPVTFDELAMLGHSDCLAEPAR